MRTMSSRRFPAKVVLVATMCMAAPAWFAGDGQSQQQKPDNAPEKRGGPTKLYFGVEACVMCHTKPENRNPILCQCIEVPIWEKKDKHKQAWNVLVESDRAKRMGDLLHINVSKAKECVSCHGVYIEDKQLQHESFSEKDGVSCVGCHGAYKEWVPLHGDLLERPAWRKRSREIKEEKYGMNDLWDPAKRAHLCASCHVGDAASGRVITHAMYAAGHPPLPGIEIATFSNKMPRHWEYLKQKKPDVQKLLQINPEEAPFEETKLIMTGAVVALNDAVRLVAYEAKACAAAKDPEKQALDLAHFDCYACHHDLKSPSWRQQRGYVGKPGRPQIRPWAITLARLAIRSAGANDRELDDHLKKVHAAFDAKPFGEPGEIALAAQGLSDWLTRVIAKLAQKKMDQATARQLLSDLCSITEKEVPDYDSARQIAWAFEVIYTEAVGTPTKDVQTVLDGLNKELKTDIPATQQRDIIKELPENLERIGNYDPKRFKALMAKLSESLRAQ